ncbi:glycosyltransferase family 2 protein [Salinimicrobium flavum]|uniref:Glycosyltransferase family 2 protein n=1 Tax=Salinimicrobium flavum TaxID=1737065 RepID=A0ABW5IWZ4_9FLAO
MQGNKKKPLSLISVVIPCHNDPNVANAVKSAVNQTYVNKEIIVVNDGSDDKDTLKAISSVRDKIDILIDQENKGQSVARNNGIKRSSGSYILNLDSDDYFENSFCEKAVMVFERDQDVKIVTCKVNRTYHGQDIGIFEPAGGDIKNFLFANAAVGSSMFRKKDWETTGGYEENLPILGFEDWEFYIQLLKNGGHAYVIPELLFHYQIRENSTTQRIRHLRQEKFKYIILKHKDLYQKNFEELVGNLFERIEKESGDKKKIENEITYRLGKALLKPFQTFRSIIRK